MTELDRKIGERIKIARKDLGMSQGELSLKASLGSSQIVSTIEKGTRSLKASELHKISKALYKDIGFFLTFAPIKRRPKFLWRGEDNCGVECDKKREGYFLNKFEQYSHLENLLNEEVENDLPQKEIKIDMSNRDFDWAERTAEEISKILQLGARPANSIFKVVEQDYGVKIWYFWDIEGISGGATKTDYGLAVLVNGREAPWRRNYDLAHELFHLITWDDYYKKIDIYRENRSWSKRLEQLADSFASSLLLPSNILRMEIRKKTSDGFISYEDLILTARNFDLSIDALLWGLKRIGFIDTKTVRNLLRDDDFRKKDKATQASRWWDPEKFPRRFVMLGVMAYKKGKITKSRLAEYFEESIAGLTDFVSKYGFDLEIGDEKKIGVDTRC